MLLIIWTKIVNFFQKCTEKPLTAWTISIGLSGNMYNIIHNMYESVKYSVKNHKTVPAVFSSHIGVRQGDPLSLFLFCMFINDSEENMRVKSCSGLTISDLKLWLMLYADDTVILSETSVGLQESPDVMYDYCEQWKLYLNVDKSKIVLFSKGGQLGRDGHWFYGDSYIDVLNSFNYSDVA